MKKVKITVFKTFSPIDVYGYEKKNHFEGRDVTMTVGGKPLNGILVKEVKFSENNL